MLRKIYHELVVIRKELQAIRSILEHKAIRFDTKGIAALKELMNTNFESEAKIRISYEQDVCTYCKKKIAKSDKYCQYCGKPTENRKGVRRMEERRKLKKSIKENMLKEQDFLIKQLELLNEGAYHVSGEYEAGQYLPGLTDAMCRVLKMMSIPYALRLGILFAVLFELLKSIVILIKKLSWSKA